MIKQARRHKGTKARSGIGTSCLRAFVPLCLAARRRGFTLIEMLTTVAVLIIVLGLMVSLARHVRDQSAQQLTRQTLKQLDALMSDYMKNNNGDVPPVIEPIIPPEWAPGLPAPSEAALA